jgi:hypothetical protein
MPTDAALVRIWILMRHAPRANCRLFMSFPGTNPAAGSRYQRDKGHNHVHCLLTLFSARLAWICGMVSNKYCQTGIFLNDEDLRVLDKGFNVGNYLGIFKPKFGRF